MNEFPARNTAIGRCFRSNGRERNLTAVAHTLVNLGNLHIASDHPEKARPYYLEAMDLRASYKITVDSAFSTTTWLYKKPVTGSGIKP